MAHQYRLHQVIDEAENQGLPRNFIDEIEPLISGQSFPAKAHLDDWVKNNVTTHLAGLLGGATVHELIERAKSA
jgi:hypothetical protein